MSSWFCLFFRAAFGCGKNGFIVENSFTVFVHSYHFLNRMGDRFVSIDCVALTASVTAAPYLYQLPQDLQVCNRIFTGSSCGMNVTYDQVYGKLLKLFKVRTSFSARDYIEVFFFKS